LNERAQDTVVALHALAEYAALTSGNGDRQNLTITVEADTLTHSFSITADNAFVLQSVQAGLFNLFVFCVYILYPHRTRSKEKKKKNTYK